MGSRAETTTTVAIGEPLRPEALKPDENSGMCVRRQRCDQHCRIALRHHPGRSILLREPLTGMMHIEELHYSVVKLRRRFFPTPVTTSSEGRGDLCFTRLDESPRSHRSWMNRLSSIPPTSSVSNSRVGTRTVAENHPSSTVAVTVPPSADKTR